MIEKMVETAKDEQSIILNSPVVMPKASGFLWNDHMMMDVNCRGYAVAQFMQPEPAKYSYAPNMEMKTFMQPEQPYFAHHPGRFVYIKDEESKKLFSAPYEPVRAMPDQYQFIVGQHEISWKVVFDEVELNMSLSLSPDEPLEMWKVTVKNNSHKQRKISIYPSFTIGYMSWMNQAGQYEADLQGIVCTSITPYQKYKDYEKIKKLKDMTFLLSDKAPHSWEANWEVFEGEGGIHNPSALANDMLSNSDARYETPAAVMQFRLTLEAEEEQQFRFLFGPANNKQEIAALRDKYFVQTNAAGEDGFTTAQQAYQQYIERGAGRMTIQTPDASFDQFVNHWLPRQIYYHGQTNRLTTDPQTRNYLQDNMGMSYIDPKTARQAFLTALQQQAASGAMPDGIILHKDAELKYINQVPHTDHCIWLPICLMTYLDETNDYSILDEMVPFQDDPTAVSVFEHIVRAMNWLLTTRDERGLNYIEQGDWCDPMNMVGYKGKGVSGWLTIASAYAFKVWAQICEDAGRADVAEHFRAEAEQTNAIANKYLWDGNWYARGITDDNVLFGVQTDEEGKIYINPQGWSLMSGAADEEKQAKILRAVEELLETPYGVEKLAPAFTKMREDVGRLTQKHPGSAENGAVYNHAAAFYIFALYQVEQQDHAYRLLRKMIPGPDQADLIHRGQLPVFIPNYYRGAYRQIPRTAGRSSHLFNTGTAAWVYRCIIDGLFGVRGSKEGLSIAPQLPSHWQTASIHRQFRGAEFHIVIERHADIKEMAVYVDDQIIEGHTVSNIQAGETYNVLVKLPQ